MNWEVGALFFRLMGSSERPWGICFAVKSSQTEGIVIRIPGIVNLAGDPYKDPGDPYKDPQELRIPV